MPLRVLRHEVPVHDLDPAHDGLTVAHVTDIHVGMLTPKRHIRRAVDAANAADADLVFLTGDYVCYAKRFVPVMGEALRGLRARTAVVATLGNHDYWTDAAGVTRELGANGYTVLKNQHTELRPRGVPLTVVGVDDAVTRHHDPAKAFHGVRRRGTTLMLTHCPEVADYGAERGAHLVVAGHTHGGQIHVRPLSERLYRRVTKKRYLAGWYLVGDTMLYVNRGVGSSSVPFRAGREAQSEVAIFTLRRVESDRRAPARAPHARAS
ncbi:MAG TPA: metallophosphoesterase [Haliangiales bacterium]|nr:metallophosphoesterase [Haliangiales bacterium]